MPKIFNTSWLAVILATVVFFALGSVWYGPLFGEVWMEGARMTEEMAIASMEQKGAMMWVGALALTLGQAIGVLMVIHLAGQLAGGQNPAYRPSARFCFLGAMTE